MAITADVTFGGAFLAGLISFVSPCVLPLVPPYLGYLAGASIEEMTGSGQTPSGLRGRLLAVAVAFVAGFATVFITLGATASVLGRLVARYQSELSFVAGIAIILMGLHFLGVFRIGLLYREARFQARQATPGMVGAYIMGLAFAFGWTPCIGPILATILGVAGAQETVGAGAALLATYAAGLGVPFVLAGFFAAEFLAWFKRFKKHLGRVEQVMGVVLVLTGLLFLSGNMQTVSYFLLEKFPALQNIG